MEQSGYPLPSYTPPPPPPPVDSTTTAQPPLGYPQQPGNSGNSYPSAPTMAATAYPAPPPVPSSSSSWSQQNINNAQYDAPQPNYYAGPPPPAAAVPAPTPQPNYNAIANPIPVVGPQYCLPHRVDLAVTRKLMTLTDDFVVTDVNQNTMFKVKGKFFSLHNKRVLLDSNGKPVVTLRHKILTAHSRWLVYRGKRSEPQDLIFSAKTSSVFQLKRKLNVYLVNNAYEDVCDYKVKGSWTDKSCVIYIGESTNVVAQMCKENNFLGKDKFMVTVNPNVDYAFIVTLIVILHAMNTEAAAAAGSSAGAGSSAVVAVAT